MCYLCIRNLLFDTSKTQQTKKNKCMVFKTQVVTDIQVALYLDAFSV